jgi:hypothetical protein
VKVVDIRNDKGPAKDPQREVAELKKVLERAAAVGARERNMVAALQKGVAKAGQNPGRFLTKQELASISTVRCLHDKQRNPHGPCQPQEEEEPFLEGTLGIGHYPHYRDRVCHSNQEFFCDPTKLMSAPEQMETSERLRLFKERTLVNCGQLESILDPAVGSGQNDASWGRLGTLRGYEQNNVVRSGRLGMQDYREFNLAVVLADEWPSSIRDATSMKTFGWRVMSEWGLQPIYNGVDNGNPVNEYRNSWNGYRANCPTTAVLIILPRYHDAFLTSPSCEFICETRGGPEVVAATLAGLDSGGLEKAILMGIEQVGKVLEATIPRSIQQDEENQPWKKYVNVHGHVESAAQSADGLIWTMRFLYAFVIFAFVFSIGAFCYFTFVPEEKQRRAGTRHLLGPDIYDEFGRKQILTALQSS